MPAGDETTTEGSSCSLRRRPTATPKRRDGHHPILEMQLGPVRFAIDAKSQAGRRPFEHRLIARETGFRATSSEPKIQELYALLAHDEARNRMIVNDVIGALEEGRSPLLLTERTDHLEFFATELARVARHVVVLWEETLSSMDRPFRNHSAARFPHVPKNKKASHRGETFPFLVEPRESEPLTSRVRLWRRSTMPRCCGAICSLRAIVRRGIWGTIRAVVVPCSPCCPRSGR